MEGIIFVCGSIAGSRAGYKIGEICFETNKKHNRAPVKLNQNMVEPKTIEKTI